jgi:hypothetical protein
VTILRQKYGLSPSSVWAIVVLILGFFGFLAFLINAGHTPEVRSTLILLGQGFFALINVWLIHQASSNTDKRVEENTKITEEVHQILNGVTPELDPKKVEPER